jgi:prevent-host-death family protein
VTISVSLHDAKTNLSALIERAAGGEEIVITKDGVAKARLLRMPHREGARSPAGALGVTFIAEDFDAPDPAVDALFAGA